MCNIVWGGSSCKGKGLSSVTTGRSGGCCSEPPRLLRPPPVRVSAGASSFLSGRSLGSIFPARSTFLRWGVGGSGCRHVDLPACGMNLSVRISISHAVGYRRDLGKRIG
ncbi:unnamed protein product [Ectocarpus fasciculatus]